MTTADRLTYDTIQSADGNVFEDFYRIYADSMTLREQKTRAEIARMTARQDYHFILVKRHWIVIGFTIMFVPIQESFALLEYMAIDRAHRNTGAGADLFRHSLRVIRSNRSDIPVLLEVDSERETSGDRAVIRRRQMFYRRLGCVRIDGLSYLLPLPGTGAPPAMDLMLHLDEKSRVIHKAELEHWLTVLYQTVYGVSPQDTRIREMTRPLEDPVKLV